jgi:hypothetical protein
MLHKLVSVMARACLLFVAAATLSPPYLRPRLTENEATLSVLLEHVGAFAVIGFLCSLYPNCACLPSCPSHLERQFVTLYAGSNLYRGERLWRMQV